MSAPTPDCPEKNALVDFLLGKLPESDIQVIEDHLSHCPPCGDTVRLLDNGDTLDELARQVMLEAPAAGPEQTRVDELIQQIQSSGQDPRRLTGDVVDRSAEVTMLLAPSSNPDHLGRIAHYEVVELLGAGGTGVVYKAIDTQLQRVVAVKILRPSLGRMARERFLAEARAAAAIDHEQVMTIYHVGEEEPLAWIAMQWLPGETLEQRLRREPVQDDEIIASVCRQMAGGLAAAHQQGLIHRDIKPANIWIESGTGRVKILDFGLARVADDDPQFTDTGMIAGTPTYMSPEQTRGAPIDHRSDLFSLGCVLHRMATGHLPFQADNVLATLQSIQRYQPPHPSELNPAVSRSLGNLTSCLLEKQPELRPQSANDVLHALDHKQSAWRFRVPEPVVPEKPVLATSGAGRRSGWLGWTIAATLIALLAWGAWNFGPQVIRIATGKGLLVIESDDPDVKIEILRNGERVLVTDTVTDQTLEFHEGVYQFRVQGDDESAIEIVPESLVLSRGGKEIVRVTMRELDSESATTDDARDTGTNLAGIDEMSDPGPLLENIPGPIEPPGTDQIMDNEFVDYYVPPDPGPIEQGNILANESSDPGSIMDDGSVAYTPTELETPGISQSTTGISQFVDDVPNQLRIYEVARRDYKAGRLPLYFFLAKTAELTQARIKSAEQHGRLDEAQSLRYEMLSLLSQMQEIFKQNPDDPDWTNRRFVNGEIRLAPLKSLYGQLEFQITSHDDLSPPFNPLNSEMQDRTPTLEPSLPELSPESLAEVLRDVPVETVPDSGDWVMEETVPPPNNQQVAVQPVYNGKTLQTWVAIANRERSFEQLRPVLAGLAGLAAESDPQVVLGALMPMLRRFSWENRWPYLGPIAEALDKMPINDAMQGIAHEIEFGNTNSRNALLLIVSIKEDDLRETAVYLVGLRNKIVKGDSFHLIRPALEATAVADARERKWTANFLFELYRHTTDHQDPEVRDQLRQMVASNLSHLDQEQLMAAARVLTFERPPLPGLAELLLTILKDTRDNSTRDQLIGIIAQLESNGAPAVDYFIERLESRETYASEVLQTIQALAEIGPAASRAIPAIEQFRTRRPERSQEDRGMGGGGPSVSWEHLVDRSIAKIRGEEWTPTFRAGGGGMDEDGPPSAGLGGGQGADGPPADPSGGGQTGSRGDSSEPVYEGKTLDEWISLSERERSFEKQTELVGALRGLADDSNAEIVLQALMPVLRQSWPGFGYRQRFARNYRTDAAEQDRLDTVRPIRRQAFRNSDQPEPLGALTLEIFASLPAEQVVAAMLQELQPVGNRRSRDALLLVFDAAWENSELRTLLLSDTTSNRILHLADANVKHGSAQRDWATELNYRMYWLSVGENQAIQDRTFQYLRDHFPISWERSLVCQGIFELLIENSPDLAELMTELISENFDAEQGTYDKTMLYRMITLGERAQPAAAPLVKFLDELAADRDSEHDQVIQVIIHFLISLGPSVRELAPDLARIRDKPEMRAFRGDLDRALSMILADDDEPADDGPANESDDRDTP